MGTPFLKWAGGKRWFTERHFDLLPTQYNRYIEPFLGSGAVFFAAEPQFGILSDINKPLIETYIAIKDNWHLVRRYLRDHHKNHCSEYYYQVRGTCPKSCYAKAARFIYLNRTCWNGLYRVNKSGQFNVPIGTKTNVVLSSDDFEVVATRLQNFDIRNDDFEVVIDMAKDGDFVFADPPYTVIHNNNGFVKYNEEMFSWEDQVRLRDAVRRATDRGVYVLLTNAYHQSVMELYQDLEMQVVNRASVIAASNANRGIYEEVIIKNW